MSVTANRSGATGTVTVAIDLTDILAMSGSAAEKRRVALHRCILELRRAIDVLGKSDAEIDAEAAAAGSAATAEATTTKAARPTGNL